MKSLQTVAQEMAWKGITLVALVAAVVSMVFAAYDVNPVKELRTEVSGILSPAADYQCPDGWVKTVGLEPETGLNFTTCTNGRYIITVREGRTPTGFDQQTGTFIDKPETLR